MYRGGGRARLSVPRPWVMLGYNGRGLRPGDRAGGVQLEEPQIGSGMRSVREWWGERAGRRILFFIYPPAVGPCMWCRRHGVVPCCRCAGVP